jgi:hypothetical protein
MKGERENKRNKLINNFCACGSSFVKNDDILLSSSVQQKEHFVPVQRVNPTGIKLDLGESMFWFLKSTGYFDQLSNYKFSKIDPARMQYSKIETNVQPS